MRAANTGPNIRLSTRPHAQLQPRSQSLPSSVSYLTSGDWNERDLWNQVLSRCSCKQNLHLATLSLSRVRTSNTLHKFPVPCISHVSVSTMTHRSAFLGFQMQFKCPLSYVPTRLVTETRDNGSS